MAKKRVIVICGPTGAGKTGSSLAVARGVNGAVVNFDSRQVYADFPVVTAQPGRTEREVCPHLLYGFLPTSGQLSAPAWADMAAIEIARLHGHGMTPILVGGTGFYLQALLSPLAPIPEISEHVRQSVLDRCKAKGPQLLHLELAKTDPEAAARIHPNDTQRVTRALEVYEATGETLSAWQAKPVENAPEYEVLTFGVGLDIHELEPKLDARIGEMLGAGALDEIRSAWERCPDRDAPGWSGIGCAELLAHHLGEMTLDEARDLWFRNTRAYAKRQMTWFKRDKAIRWFRPGEADAMAREAVRFMG